MSQPRLACWSALAVCLTTGAAAAAEKPKVVVLPMEGSTESLVRIGSSISEQILTELGRTELVEAITGLLPIAGGTVTFRGSDITSKSPRQRQEVDHPNDDKHGCGQLRHLAFLRCGPWLRRSR